MENNFDITKPRYNKQSSLSAPWPFVIYHGFTIVKTALNCYRFIGREKLLALYTAIARKVGKRARANSERYCG